MKKIKALIAIVMLTIATVTNAQVNLGIKGGLNLSNYIGKDASECYKIKPGFHAGLTMDYEFVPGMAIQSGVMFHMKGTNLKKVDNAKITLTYVQVPVHFAYKADITPGSRVVFHAGPYAAIGITAKSKVGNESSDLFRKEIISMNRFDAGLGFGVGAELGSFLIDVNTDFGLVKLYDDVNYKNGNIMISVGYLF